MRAVKLTEFLSLPEGTLYEQISPNHVPEGMIMIKGDTLSNNHDWYEMSVGGAATILSEDYPNSLDGWCALLENSDLRVPYQDDVWGRHGTYPTEEDKYTYLIYEHDDVAKMISLLTSAWFMSKYPTTRFEWGYNGIVILIENLLAQSTNDHPTVIYQMLTHDGWLDCPREDYLRTYKTDPNCTRIVSLVVEGRNDLVLNYFQASMMDADTTQNSSTETQTSRGSTVDHFDPPASWSAYVGVLWRPRVLGEMSADTEFAFKKYIETICFVALDFFTIASLKTGVRGEIPIVEDDLFYPMLSKTHDGTKFSLFVICDIAGSTKGFVLADCYFDPKGKLIFGNVIAIPKSKLKLTCSLFSYTNITISSD